MALPCCCIASRLIFEGSVLILSLTDACSIAASRFSKPVLLIADVVKTLTPRSFDSAEVSILIFFFFTSS
jgi:hypothetical protein